MSLLLYTYFLSTGLTAYASSSETDLYTVKNITVDITADSAKSAQEKAMNEGRVTAFETLLDKLLSADDRKKIGKISTEQSESLLQDYEVVKEKYSSIRYIASLTFRFDPHSVKNFLKEKHIEVAATLKNPVLVIPLLLTSSEVPELWHDNPWLSAWASRSFEGTLTPLIVPLGDLADLTTLDAKQALSVDQESLNAMARRYGACATMVVQARAVNEYFKIEMILVPLEGEMRKISLDPLLMSGISLEKVYHEAITKTVRELDALEKNKTEAVISSQEQHLRIKAIFNTPRDWIYLQQKLKEIPTVTDVRLKTLSHTHAFIDLIFLGTIPTLESALGVRGFNLIKEEGHLWTISPKTPNTSKL